MSLNRAYGSLLEQTIQYNHSGLITGTDLVIIDADTFRIPPTTVVFVDRSIDPASPISTNFSLPQTDYTIVGGGDQVVYVYVTSAGAYRYGTDAPSAGKITEEVHVGKVVMDSGVIVRALFTPVTAYSNTVDGLSMLAGLGGHAISGSVLSSGGADLTLSVAAGDHHQLGRGFSTNFNEPNQCSTPAVPVFGFTGETGQLRLAHRAADGSLIFDANVSGATPYLDPEQYNNGGTLAAVPVNDFQAIRFIQFCGAEDIVAYYGAATYATLTAAEDGYVSEEPESFATLDGSWIGTLLIKKGVTDIATAIIGGDAKFINKNGIR